MDNVRRKNGKVRLERYLSKFLRIKRHLSEFQGFLSGHEIQISPDWEVLKRKMSNFQVTSQKFTRNVVMKSITGLRCRKLIGNWQM